MKETRTQVEDILKNYISMKQRLKGLEFALKGFQYPLNPKMIEAKVFSHSGGERVACPQPRDQTSDIVVDHVDKQRNERYLSILSTVESLRAETKRLEYYLSILPAEEAEVIRWFYFKGLSWSDIALKTDLTARTMQRRRKKGLDRLVSLYDVAFLS